MPKRVLCSYGIDIDAVSGWINTRDGKPANPKDVSRGVFGATIGIDGLLKLFAQKNDIKATWFTPAHSAKSFPSQIRKIVDTGHEGLHGYMHEFVSRLSEQQQRDVLEESIAVVTQLTGEKPRGWTAPAGSTSNEVVKLLEEFGIMSRLQ